MRRNVQLVRRLLIAAEGSSGTLDARSLAGDGCGVDEIAFHVEMMQARGLVTAKVVRSGSGAPVQVDVLGITWEGYDYLDAVRSDDVWRRANAAISKTVGVTTLSVVKETCQAIASALVKSQLGL